MKTLLKIKLRNDFITAGPRVREVELVPEWEIPYRNGFLRWQSICSDGTVIYFSDRFWDPLPEYQWCEAKPRIRNYTGGLQYLEFPEFGVIDIAEGLRAIATGDGSIRFERKVPA